MTIRILICCHDELFGTGLRALLAIQEDFEIIGEARTAVSAVDGTHELQPDVILVTGSEFGLSMIHTVSKLVRVIVILDEDSSQTAVQMLALGARAVLSPGPTPHQLLMTIRLIADGPFLLAPVELTRQFQRLAGDHASQAHSPMPRLTVREHEVLELIAHGLSDVDIARKLCISNTTVRSHVHHMLGKLSVHSRAQAVAIAYQAGLIAIGE